MPLNVQKSSRQMCIVIKIKALSGIKGFYFEVHTMVLEIRLALYCPARPSDCIGCVLEPAQHHVGPDCLMSCVAFAPNHKMWMTEHVSETMV